MDDLISKLSEIRSNYDCFNESEEPYYRALSEAIKKLSERTASNHLQDLPTSPLLVGKLPSAQPENADCIYCHEDSDGYVKPIEKNCHAFIRFGMDGWELSLKANGWHGSAKIRYCPMCGRDLFMKWG